MALATITDLVARARARVLKQYVDLTGRFLPLLDAFTGQAQELETAVWGFVAKLDLATADAIWLDRLGWMVGEAREGESDTVYRRLIYARILANKSNGTMEEIFAVLRLVLADPVGLVVTARNTSPASIELLLTGYVFAQTADALRLANRLQRLLAITRAAGVRLMVVTEPIDEATSFRFSTTGALVLSARGFGDEAAPATVTGHFRSAFVA